jgi:hypothetical protein
MMQRQRRRARCRRQVRSGSRSCRRGRGRVQQKVAGDGQPHWWSAHWLALAQGSGAVSVCCSMLHGGINILGFWLSGFFVQEE